LVAIPLLTSSLLVIGCLYSKSNTSISNIKVTTIKGLKYTYKETLPDNNLEAEGALNIIASIKAMNILDRVFSTSSANNSTRKVLGWIPFWDQQSAFASFKQNVASFDYISVFWYLLRSDGSVNKYIYASDDSSVISFAHSKKVKVLALVANLPDEDERGNWDPTRVDKVISSSSARKKHIADLVALAKSRGFDGINIDYEALRKDQKENFTAFIKELSFALHKHGKILAVALHPKITEGDPAYSNGSEAQDWRQLSKYADQLHLMTYEQHWEDSPPGPIASVLWVFSVLNYAKQLIPANKLFAGIPLYGYDWSNTPKAKGLTYQNVQSLISQYKPKVTWDPIAQSHHFGYRAAGVTHSVWYEDDASFKKKMELFNYLDISNLAFWRLGGEDTRVWNTLRNSP